MNTALIGFQKGIIPGADTVAILSQQHLAHYDVIALTPEALVASLCNVTKFSGADRVYDSDIQQKLPLIQKRLQLIRELIDSGTVLLVLVSQPLPEILIVSKDTDEVAPLEYDWLWFQKEVRLTPVSGIQSDFCGPQDLALLEEFKQLEVRYTCAIDADNSVPFLRAPAKLIREQHIIGVVRHIGRGAVVYAPYQYYFSPVEDRLKDARRHVLRSRYIDWLVNVSRKASAPAGDRPPWTSKYYASTNAAAANKLSDLERLLAQTEKQVKLALEELATDAWISDVVSAEGRALECAVVKCFSEMKIPAALGPEGRADVLVKFGQSILVLEVKGYLGGAAEKAILQSNRWVAEVDAILKDGETDSVLEQYKAILADLSCSNDAGAQDADFVLTGLIIANTFREIEPEKRPDMKTQMAQHFPTPFQAKLGHHQLRAMTGLQLLGLLDTYRRDSQEAYSKLSSIISAPGVTTEFVDWSTYLTKIE